jgi:hypothetical protein
VKVPPLLPLLTRSGTCMAQTDGWTYTHFYEFTRDQADPIGGVLFDSGGNLYGTSSKGGADRAGIAWEITP